MEPSERIALAQKGQEILSILRDPRFRSKFTIVGLGDRYWKHFEAFVTQNSPVLLALIERIKFKGIDELIEENERLKSLLKSLNRENMERDLEIIRLHRAGYSQYSIAKKTGMSPKGVKKARIRLGLVSESPPNDQ